MKKKDQFWDYTLSISIKFLQLIKNEQFEDALEVARDQVLGGAQIIDVNMDEGMIDGVKAMTTFLNLIASEPEISRIPIMIDSSKWDIIEAGLKVVMDRCPKIELFRPFWKPRLDLKI